jgi:hypothetical protein
VAITDFDVREAMPLLWKGSKGLDQKLKALSLEGELTRLRSEDLSLQSEEVADIECFKELEGLIADGILLEVSLNSSLSILNLDKAGLTEVPDRYDPTCKTESFFDRFQLFI